MNSISSLATNGALWALLAAAPLLPACSDNEETITYQINADTSQLTKSIAWNEVESTISFTATADWSVVADKSASWITISIPSGHAGNVKLPFVLAKNNNENPRQGKITISCGDQLISITVNQDANPSAVSIMDPTTITDYDKYIIPGTHNDGFQKGPEGMLRSDAKWSWWRMKQSEHFFVFWEPGFGNNPNADTIPEAMRVDIDDLLEKAELFFNTNVNKLKMATLGEGKSALDKYKMQIYLLYQSEWLATGSGYDDIIGALWVNPSTCQPVGSTIGHEIGHSFQYQVAADKLFSADAAYQGSILPVGFRYGFGENGAGGCAYWEQCAQWQSYQDYPDQAFSSAHIPTFLANCHRRFCHEWQRYASYWFQYYFTEKHGIEAFARIWKESQYPEDPVDTYLRLFCNGDINTLWDDFYNYAARCANYDFNDVHQYLAYNPTATNFSTKFFKTNNGYQVAYESCPSATGFNLIPVNVPAAGTTISATLTSLTPGSALASGDPGTIIDGDGKTVGNTTTYNTQANADENFRFGFVAYLANNECVYSEMQSGKNGTATFTVPEGVERISLCVTPAPSSYNRAEWDDDMTNDDQWPYIVNFSNTDLLGNLTLTPGDPYNVNAELAVNLDFSSTDYCLKTFNLLNEGVMEKIAQAFKLQPADIASATLAASDAAAAYAADTTWTPAEGQIAVGITNPDGWTSYAYSANGIGFWIAEDGTSSTWGASPIYFEYTPSSYSLAIGHAPGGSKQGQTYVIKPTFIYNCGGTIYKAVISVSMIF